MRKSIAFAAAVGFLALWTFANLAPAATITLDGTGGSNVDSGAYSTTGDLNVSLGFFVEHLIVAGGGGGGRWGGGGAGGLITGTAERSNLNYPISVGAGGAGVNLGTPGGNGGDSTAFGLTAVGGGGGAEFNAAGQNGGSGGGGGATDTAGAKLGGTGTAGQGNAGGSATQQGGNPFPGGGGGGAGSAGGSTVGSVAGNGGAGLSSSITGTSLFVSVRRITYSGRAGVSSTGAAWTTEAARDKATAGGDARV